ncbi:GNAT family N-acetyltransferase [Alkalicoccobacillus murimartini]|uniref:Ribosomal-protein-serine acetyltransferase n=1 Tax=Alkalicoccobacillus murimartini TaxID=171685 RepID=A0ABT9YCU5_9BACI|nr:GNAT family protein [Alkalicoccobacillus murimartini]MDQ0205351.1 ribosomal-protein-serine acetyltransferase [Alkalicoccobacillus murimartini]
MDIHIEHKDISLSTLKMQDAEELFNLTEQSRHYLRQWLPWLDQIKKVEDTRTFIKYTLIQNAENKSINVAINYNEQIVGIAGFNELDWNNGIAKIGYWLAEEYQGKGIMLRVVKALIDHAFCTLNLNKVEIRVAEQNSKSRNIPIRLGFVEEGCIRQAEKLYDHYVDHIVYGVLAAEWEKPTEN